MIAEARAVVVRLVESSEGDFQYLPRAARKVEVELLEIARQIHAETVDEEDEDGKSGLFNVAGMEGKAQAGKTEGIDGSGRPEFNGPRGVEVFRLRFDSDGAGAVEDGTIACDLHLGTAVSDQLPVGSYALVED